jgi:hypothetical protein
MRVRTLCCVVLIVAVVAVGCGGGGSNATKSPSSSPSTGASTASTGSTASSGSTSSSVPLAGPSDLCVMITKAEAEAVVGPNARQQDSGMTECVWGSQDSSKRIYVQRLPVDSPGATCGPNATPSTSVGDKAEKAPGCFAVKVINTAFLFGCSDTSIDMEPFAVKGVGRL